MKSYLSIDLDFWTTHDNGRSAGQFFNKVFALNVPILFVHEHEELLQDINKSKSDILYNVDYHSDLCSDNELIKGEKPNDGTWANFVSWKRRGEYIWICPNIKTCYKGGKGDGICCGDWRLDPFKTKKESFWKSVSLTQKLNTIDWRTVKQVGVCLSPSFTIPETVLSVTKKLGMKEEEVYALTNAPTHINPAKRKRGIIYKAA